MKTREHRCFSQKWGRSNCFAQTGDEPYQFLMNGTQWLIAKGCMYKIFLFFSLLSFFLTGVWSRKGKWRTHLGSSAHSPDCRTRHSHCLPWYGGPNPFYVSLQDVGLRGRGDFGPSDKVHHLYFSGSLLRWVELEMWKVCPRWLLGEAQNVFMGWCSLIFGV